MTDGPLKSNSRASELVAELEALSAIAAELAKRATAYREIEPIEEHVEEIGKPKKCPRCDADIVEQMLRKAYPELDWVKNAFKRLKFVKVSNIPTELMDALDAISGRRQKRPDDNVSKAGEPLGGCSNVWHLRFNPGTSKLKGRIFWCEESGHKNTVLAIDDYHQTQQ